MDDYNKPSPRKLNTARQRQANRYRRREAFVMLKEKVEEGTSRLPELPALPRPTGLLEVLRWLWLRLQDGGWYLVYRTPLLKIGAAVIALTVLLVMGGLLLSPNIPPNVWSFGMPLSGYTVPEAEARLRDAWQNQLHITITLAGSQFAEVAPEQLGMVLDTKQMIDQARGAGLSGIPFGVTVEPVLRLDEATAQDYMLSIVDQVYIAPYEAGYRWQGDMLVGLPGTASRELDVALTLERLKQSPDAVLQNRRLELLTTSTQPAVTDPSPYLARAQSFLVDGFKLVGYDPFVNEFMPWTTTREEMAKWLVAGVNSLTVREDGLKPFVTALNDRLRQSNPPRYVDAREVAEVVSAAISAGQTESTLRVRYMPLIYEIDKGDYGLSISRKTGMPFNLIDNANPGLDWNILSVGQEINLPSPDELLPETPIASKRIVVDLDKMWLVAFEDAQVKYSYPISVGRNEAPTYPGIFQILTHNPTAFGSSFTLCKEGTTECGQWEMQWFMGVYEVIPGLMNGLHGDVLLPNGFLLGGGGGAQSATTFGCVMADNSNAKALYDWAETGTMVEILAYDYAPRSDLGRQAYDLIRNNPAVVTG